MKKILTEEKSKSQDTIPTNNFHVEFNFGYLQKSGEDIQGNIAKTLFKYKEENVMVIQQLGLACPRRENNSETLNRSLVFIHLCM